MMATWTIELTTKVVVLNILMSLLSDITVTSRLQTMDDNTVEKLSVEAALVLRHERILKQQEFKKTKTAALKDIPKEIRPGTLIQEGNFTSMVMEYDGEPMPLFIIIIAMVPLVFAELCRVIWNLIKPKLKFQLEGGGEFPFTACYHLQESLKEQSLKRPARNCTSWFVHQYILSIEDETLEWKDVVDSLQVPQPVRRKKPWHTIRLIFRLKNALRKEISKSDEEIADNPPDADGDNIEDLSSHPTVDTLHLEHQISQLELHYQTLNALEKDYEVPSPPHPELFTVRELMKFMTRDEKLLVLRCFDKSQMDELMINCNIDEIRKRNEEFVQAHAEAGAHIYEHVEKLNSKPTVERKTTQTGASVGKVEEKENSIEILFDIKDHLAQEIVDANDQLLEEWENSQEKKDAEEEILPLLQPFYTKTQIIENDTDADDILDALLIDEQPDELKGIHLTSEERVEHILKKAEFDIDDIEKRIEVKKKYRKKGKWKSAAGKAKAKKKAAKAAAEKGKGKPDEKTPFKWQKKSEKKDDIPEVLEIMPKIKHPEVEKKRKDNKHKKKKPKKPDNAEENEETTKPKETKEQRASKDDTEEKHVNASGDKGRRNTDENKAMEKQKQKRVSGEKDRKISGNETREHEKRKISEDAPKGEPQKISEDEPRHEHRKHSQDEPKHQHRKNSEDEPKQEQLKQSEEEPKPEHRKHSEDEPKLKHPKNSDNEPRHENRKHSDGEPKREHRKHSQEEPKEEYKKHSQEEPKEEYKTHSQEEPKEEYKKRFEDEPKLKHRKHSEDEPRHENRKKSEDKSGQENRKHSESDPLQKQKHRKHSGDEPKAEHRRHSGDERKPEHRKHSGDERNPDIRKHSGDEPRDDQQKTFEIDPKEGERRKPSEDERNEREIQKSNQMKRREEEQRRISENERIENDKQKLSEKEGGKETLENEAKDHIGKKGSDKGDGYVRKKSNIEEDTASLNIGIQTHHHHHHLNQKLPTLMLNQQEKRHRSFEDNSSKTNPQNIDANVVHNTTDNNDIQLKKKELTKSEAMAIQRNTIFQENKHQSPVKFYGHSRRKNFDDVLHTKLVNPGNDNSPGTHGDDLKEEQIPKEKRK